MALINLDFNIEDVVDNFAPLPTGNYPCKLTKQEMKKSGKGNDMLAVEWTVTEGEHAGKKIFDYVTLNTDWKVKQYAELIGVTSGSSFDPDLFNGLEAVIAMNCRDQTPKEKGDSKLAGRDPDVQVSVIKSIVVIGS